MKTIGVCGLGYTGSGAVIDLLREYEGISVKENPEFSITYTPDGIEDLEYHLVTAPTRYMSSDVAIYRFYKYVKGRNNRGSGIRIASNNQFYNLSMDYISSITQLSWKGYWGWDFNSASTLRRNFVFRILKNRITPILGKLMRRNLDLPPVRDMYLSVNPDCFYEASRSFIRKLLDAMGLDGAETIVLNQPFAADHPTKSFRFYENPFAIVVDRDPRDIYVLMKRVTLDQGRFIPTEDVRDFVEYYKILHLGQEDTTNRSDVIQIQFEDLIYRYEDTVSQVERQLGLSGHIHKYDYFNPDVSINNTQLFLRYPQFKKDCEFIAKELEPWLYQFDRFEQKPNWRNESF